MTTFWSKIKAFLCCGEAEEPITDIGMPFGFARVDVDFPGLTEHERELIKNRPVPVTYPLNHDGTRDRAVTRVGSLGDTTKSVTINPMSTFGAKGSDYSALANRSSLIMQHLNSEEDQTSNDMKQLLPRCTGGPEPTSSTEAGCWRGANDPVRTFGSLK